MKDVNKTRSRNKTTRIVYIKKEEAGHSRYVAARVLVMIMIVVVLLGCRSLDWNMLLNLWGALVESHSTFRAFIWFTKLLSCWLYPHSCAGQVIESLDVP
jgi:hypothetical protein